MSKEQTKLFTRAEVKDHKDPNTNLIILHDKVYDVVAFLNEHPGGEEILAKQRGEDASEEFNDVGHSTDAKELMLTFLVGELVEAERSKTKPKEIKFVTPKNPEKQQEGGLPYGLIAIAIIIIILAYNLGIFSSS